MATATKNGSPHRWRFYVAGGVNQVRIDTGADIVHLRDLDQKLWVALSCPVRGLEFDERTLALLDTDVDGRVRAPEIIAASSWLGTVLEDPDSLVGGKDGFELGNLDVSTPAGKQLLDSAKHILAGLGKATATTVTVDDTMKTAQVFAQSKLNGDGVVPPDTIDDAAAGKVAAELLDCIGGTIDRSGKQGVDAARVETFFAECAAYAEWVGKATADPKTILPFGEGTAAAAVAFEAVALKVEDFFLRGRLAAYDPRAQAAVNRSEAAYLDAAAKDLSITATEVVSLPIALSEPGKALPLGGAVNPAWEAKLAAFRLAAVVPAHGKDKTSLTQAEWDALGAKLAPFRAWAASKAGAARREARHRAREGDPRGRDEDRHRQGHRRRPLRRARDRRAHPGRAPRALPPRLPPAAAQLRVLQRLLRPQEGDLPGRHALPRRARDRPLRPRRRPGQARPPRGHVAAPTSPTSTARGPRARR